jgi:hypothetical protein
MANGVALTSACELGIARWVKTGSVKPDSSAQRAKQSNNE